MKTWRSQSEEARLGVWKEIPGTSESKNWLKALFVDFMRLTEDNVRLSKENNRIYAREKELEEYIHTLHKQIADNEGKE